MPWGGEGGTSCPGEGRGGGLVIHYSLLPSSRERETKRTFSNILSQAKVIGSYPSNYVLK